MSKTINYDDEELDQIASHAAGLSKIFGFLNENKRRDFLIRRDFVKLRRTKEVDEAELELSEKYFLSKDTIHTIVYKKNGK